MEFPSEDSCLLVHSVLSFYPRVYSFFFYFFFFTSAYEVTNKEQRRHKEGHAYGAKQAHEGAWIGPPRLLGTILYEFNTQVEVKTTNNT